MNDILQDLRFALRGWVRSPGFVIAAIATLALGIGANTAIFSVVSGVLLRPLPYASPDRLVEIRERQPPSSAGVGFEGGAIFRDYLEWRANSKLLDGLTTHNGTSKNLTGSGEPQQVQIVQAERNLFAVLGVPPQAGRVFRDGEPSNVAVASGRFWRTHFGGDPSAIGRTVMLDDQPFTLIGVMPDDFRFPYGPAVVELWLPWDQPADMRTRPNARIGGIVARLKPGVAIEAARQELASMEATVLGGREVKLTPMMEVVSGPVRNSLLVLLGAVGLVMLVACVNVANLLLARTAAREREIAIRAALGAGRLRIIRQFLTESLLLAAAGGAAGLALGVWGSRVLVQGAAAQVPRASEIGLDWRVFLFLLAVCAITGIGFGLAPALAAARGGSGKLAARGATSAVRDGLVVTEIAMAFVLLAGAGLLVRTFLNLQRTDAGVQAENVITVHVATSGGPESMAIEERVAQIPGVRAAGFVSMLPLQASGWGAGFRVKGRPDIYQTELRYVTPGYFRAIGIPLRRGRQFTNAEPPRGPLVIMVNEALVRQCFRGEDPIGRETDRGTIIGVVADVRQKDLSEPAKPEIYYTMMQNFAQIRRNGSTLVVRSAMPPETIAAQIRTAIREVSPNQPVFRIATMEEVIHESLANPRLYTWLLGLFGLLGVVLAAAGIYGVVAYLVTLRTREFGIRMALGADRSRVLRMVMGRGAALVALGLAIGIAGAAAVTRVLRGLLYGVTSTDPITFGAMALLLAAVALAACAIPARRAALVDPAVALRAE